MRWATSPRNEVARLDAAAADRGVTTLQLMEVAGWQVARCAWHRLGGPAPVSVVAGYGNNGGDGLVAARHLATWGCTVRVLVLGSEERVTGVVRDHVLSARRCGVDVVVEEDPGLVGGVLSQSKLGVDAILGTGLRSAPREPQARAIRAINKSGIPILSIDVPSGLDATTGEAFDPTVRAGADLHADRHEAGPAPRRRAGPRRRRMGRRHRHARDRLGRSRPSPTTRRDRRGVGAHFVLISLLDRRADSRLFFDRTPRRQRKRHDQRLSTHRSRGARACRNRTRAAR